MLSLSEYIAWFTVFSLIGWVYECILNVFKEGSWANRGFLFGPMIPIYGVGVVSALVVFDNEPVQSGTVPLWAVFLIAAIGSAVLEYATSVVMERLFHARWWDYSDMPLNLNGRICLLASVLFGVGGALVAWLLVPVAHTVSVLVPHWAFDVAGFVSLALFAVDTTLSLSALTQLVQKVEQASEQFDQLMSGSLETVKGKLPSLSDIPAQAKDMLPSLSDIPAQAKDMLPEVAHDFLGSLTQRQKRVLSSIKGFTGEKASRFDRLMRRFFRDAAQRVKGRKR